MPKSPEWGAQYNCRAPRRGSPRHPSHAFIQVDAQFVNREALDLSGQIDEPLASKRLMQARPAGPTAVVALAVHFDVEAALIELLTMSNPPRQQRLDEESLSSCCSIAGKDADAFADVLSDALKIIGTWRPLNISCQPLIAPDSFASPARGPREAQ